MFNQNNTDSLKKAYFEVKEENEELRQVIKQSDEIIEELNQEIRYLKEKYVSKGRKPITQAQIDKIISLKNEGKSYKQIERITGISTPTIAKYLKKNGLTNTYHSINLYNYLKAMESTPTQLQQQTLSKYETFNSTGSI